MPWQLTNLRGKGAQAEALALRFLKRQGLRLVARNFACRYGELDLVMLDGDTLVFIEVRCRGQNPIADAKSSITAKKMDRIRTSAACFLQHHDKHSHRDCRFDVVAISTTDVDGKNRLEWITGAF